MVLPVEIPPEAHGDLAFPLFPYARPLGRPPQVLSQELQGAFRAGPLVGAATAAGGYVNLHLDRQRFAHLTLESVLQLDGEYGSLPPKGKRAIVEHTSVNPNGPLHVGRARNPLIGDAFARILRRAGYSVTREYYVNDMGKQMILLAWAVRNLSAQEVGPPEREGEDYRLVKYYQAAAKRTKEDPSLDAEIKRLAQRYEEGDEALAAEVRAVAERALGGILRTLEGLNIRFDHFFWESRTIFDGSARRVAEALKAVSQASQEDGAWYLDLGEAAGSSGASQEDGAHEASGEGARWVFLRRDGTTLYTTRDLAYHLDKFRRCDKAVNVLGEDQKLGHRQLKAALKALGVGREPEALFYAFVVLPEGRLSTRKGMVVYLDDLVEEALERAKAEVDRRRPELPEERRRTIARTVGLGALKYNYLRVQPEKKIVFRWEEALNFEGNSAPFLQYAHARTCGILEKAGGRGEYDPAALQHPAEFRLLKTLARLPSTVVDCAEGQRPHAMATYALEAAGLLNEFYRDCPVLASPEPLRGARLAVVDATRIVLRNALDCLGIEAPREM
jgi:arginyl-tRNA synthetase